MDQGTEENAQDHDRRGHARRRGPLGSHVKLGAPQVVPCDSYQLCKLPSFHRTRTHRNSSFEKSQASIPVNLGIRHAQVRAERQNHGENRRVGETHRL